MRYHPFPVAPSALRAPINRFKPRELSSDGVRDQIADFVQLRACSRSEAGYDGVEIMGSEGYFINEFLAPRTNQRTDEWGGSLENRARLALEIVRQTRAAVGRDFIIIFRISGLDLVEGGGTGAEVEWLASQMEARRRDHAEHRHRLARGAHSDHRRHGAARRIRLGVGAHQGGDAPAGHRHQPVQCARGCRGAARRAATRTWFRWRGRCSRIRNCRARRPKAASDEINTCIACNQGCLDKVFENKRATCLVNPLAAYETELRIARARAIKRIAVVGAGPAGLACATTLAERGHRVTLFERAHEIGGQFRYAREVPGKEDFRDTLRYFARRIELTGVELRLNTTADAASLAADGFDDFIISSGVAARVPQIAGIEHPKVISYPDLLVGRASGRASRWPSSARAASASTWRPSSRISRARTTSRNGASTARSRSAAASCRRGRRRRPAASIYCSARPGGSAQTLGKTTGWIHRTALKHRGVVMRNGVSYQRIDDAGLHIVDRGGPGSAGGRARDHLRGAGVGQRAGDRACRHRQAGARDRRRVARGRARRGAGDPRRRDAGGEDMSGDGRQQEWGQSPFSAGLLTGERWR